MPAPDRACVIVNPAAGRGRGARALPAVRAAFAAVGITDVRVSTATEREGAVAAQAIAEGCTTLVAVGGDGTWSNVANAILRAGADTRLALVAAGTGNDFAKTAGAPARDLPATARLVAEGAERRVDVGRIEDRWFLNIAGFGFDVAVLENLTSTPWLRGDALYVWTALKQLGTYGGSAIDISTPARARGGAQHLILIVANARHFGGAFRIAPGASITDGKLDAVAIRDASPLRRLRLFGAVIRGVHERMADVDVERSGSFTLRFPAPPAYEVDGEYHRAASSTLEIACVPGALRLAVPADAAVP
jgi:diacylglycerol kinase (ATP)